MDRRRRVLAYGLILVTVCAAAGIVVLHPANRGIGVGADTNDWLRLAVSPLVTVPLAGLLAIKRPRHPIGWLILTAALLQALSGFGDEYGAAAIVHGWPFGALALLVGSRLTASVVAIPPLVLLLFPTGRLPSRRWKPVAVAALVVAAAFVTLGLVSPKPYLDNATNPALLHARSPFAVTGAGTIDDQVAGVLLLADAAVLLLALVSLGVRLRRSDGDERAQLSWFCFAGVFIAADLALGHLLPSALDTAAGILASALLTAAITIAVLRYHLYDIQLVINRTLLWGLLTSGVVGAYVAVVALASVLVRRHAPLVGSLAATGLIAALFGSAKDRLQRVVDRMTYGDRSDPYRALSRLGQRLASATVAEEVLPGLARSVTEALRLPYAAVEMVTDDGLATITSHGRPTGHLVRLPLQRHGERVGVLVVSSRSGFSAADRALLDDLARHAAVAVSAVALTADLRRSRERIVTAREEERRRLRRDLHDGLGPTLAAITVRAGAAARLAKDRPELAVESLLTIAEDAQAAVREVRRLVHELRPPALDELGLAGALRSQADKFGPALEVTVDTHGDLSALPAAVEVAAYRIACEALANAARHAVAHYATVRLQAAGELKLDIVDDGKGIPPDREAGVGLTSMRERAAELGAQVDVRPGDGGGTIVSAVFPLTTAMTATA
jgi:two-component system NarL family sensor kinase